MPIVRTFTPITAGISKMDYRTFVTYNVIGGTIWAFGVTLLGYFLGQIEVVEQNLELAILSVVAISLAPIAVELLQGPAGEARAARWPTSPTTCWTRTSAISSTRPATPTASSSYAGAGRAAVVSSRRTLSANAAARHTIAAISTPRVWVAPGLHPGSVHPNTVPIRVPIEHRERAGLEHEGGGDGERLEPRRHEHGGDERPCERQRHRSVQGEAEPHDERAGASLGTSG